MPRNQLTKDEIRIAVLQFKKNLYNEHIDYRTDIKGLANKYLDMVLDKIEEYRY
jgi:hypothetical protein